MPSVETRAVSFVMVTGLAVLQGGLRRYIEGAGHCLIWRAALLDYPEYGKRQTMRYLDSRTGSAEDVKNLKGKEWLSGGKQVMPPGLSPTAFERSC